MSEVKDENVSQKLQTLNQCLNLQQLEESIELGSEYIEYVKDTNAILVLGNTGVGKSTTICYLCGAEMVEKEIDVECQADGELQQTQRSVIDSAEPFETFVIGHRQASETSFINVIPIPDKTDLVICDVPGFEDSRGAAIDLSNTICLNEAIQKTKTLRIVLLLNYHELLAKRGQLIKDILNLISGCFKDGKFEENISKIQVHYTHARDKTIEKDIYPILVSVKNEIKPDEERAKALLDHIIELASPSEKLQNKEDKKSNKKQQKFVPKKSISIIKSMIIDPLNQVQRLELLNKICDSTQVRFDNPAEILEFKPNELTYDKVKLFMKSIQGLVQEFMNEKKCDLAFQVLEKTQILKQYVKFKEVTDSISEICDGMKSILFTKQNNIKNTIQQTLVNKGQFQPNTLEDIEDYLQLIKLWDEKKELYFDGRGIEQLQFERFIEVVLQQVKEYSDSQLEHVSSYEITDQITFFSSFYDQLQSLHSYFDNLGEIKIQFMETLTEIIQFYEKQCQSEIDTFLKLGSIKENDNQEEKTSESQEKSDQLDKILVSFDTLLLWQDKFRDLNESYKSIYQTQKQYLEEKLNFASKKMSASLQNIVTNLSDQINNQSNTECNQKSSTQSDKTGYNDLRSMMYIFYIMSSNRKVTKLFPNLTKVYIDLIKECNQQVKQFLDTLTEKLQKHLKSQQLHQWKNYLNEIDDLKNLISHQIKSLKQQNLEDQGLDDIDQKYMQFKSRLLNKANDIVEEINHYTMILQNSDSEQDILAQLKKKDIYSQSPQEKQPKIEVNIAQIKEKQTLARLFLKLNDKITVIQNLYWMDEYFDTDTVSRSLRKAKKRVRAYLGSLQLKILDALPNVSYDAKVWHQIAEYYFQIAQMKKFKENINEIDAQVAECQLTIKNQLEDLGKDCEGLVNELKSYNLCEYQQMKKLNFKIEQLTYIQEFDTIADKIKPFRQQLIYGWEAQVKKAYNDIRKICDGAALFSQNSNDLEQINNYLDMFKSMEEFEELKDIQLPNINRTHSIYKNLIEILKQSCNDLSNTKQQYINNKKMVELEKIDQFFRQCNQALRNHLEDLSKQTINFNDLSTKISSEMEKKFSERKWQQIAEFIMQNVQIDNPEIKSQIDALKLKIKELHDTAFESLEGQIYQLQQNEQNQEKQSNLSEKLRLITDLKKHFHQILDKEFYSEKEKQLNKVMVNWMKKLQDNIEFYRKSTKYTQMDEYYRRYLKFLESFDRSFLWTEGSIKLKSDFEEQFQNDFIEQPIDFNAHNFSQIQDELKKLIDSSQMADVMLRQIYADKLDKIQKSITKEIFSKEETVNKFLQESQFKDAEREISVLKKLTKKFETVITNPQHKISDLEQEIQKKKNQALTNIEEKLAQVVTPGVIEELNQDIAEKYNKSKNPQMFEQLQQNFEKKFTTIQMQIKIQLNNSPLDYESIADYLQTLQQLSNIKCICTQDTKFLAKLQECQKMILDKVTSQIKSINDKLKNNFGLAEQDLIDFCQGLKFANKIKFIQPSESETKAQNQIKQYSLSINQTLSKLIRDVYHRFNINLKNLQIFELQKSLQELKKLNPIISFIKVTDELELMELELSDELIAYKKSEDIQIYKVAEEQMDKEINDLEKQSSQHFENKEYDKFCKKLKSIKELSVLNQTGQDNLYNKLVQEKNQFINSVGQFMNDKIENNIFDKELQEMFNQLDKMGKAMYEIQDIGQVIEKIKAQSMGQVIKKLELAQSEFRQQSNDIASAGEMLIKIAKLCDDVPFIKRDVDQTLRKCMDYYVSDVGTRDAKIGELWDYFQQLNDDIGNQIILTIPHFIQQNQQDRNSKTHATHNPEYVLSKFKLLSNYDNSFNEEQKQMFQDKKQADLKKEQKVQLEKMYNNYTKRYNDLIETYTIKKFGQKKEILDSIKNNIQFKYYKFENWNDSCKNKMNDLFAMVSAYWSLMGIKDDELSFNKKSILKQPHASQIFSIMFLLGFDKTDAGIMGGTRFSKTSFDNQLIQILTGEGKSIILGLLAALLALIGYNVDVACYSKYLSQRDYEDFLPLFKELGIEKKVSYGTFCDLSEKIINKAGDLREMSQNLLKGLPNQLSQDNKAKSILLIDEVDVFFSSDFYGQTYNPATLFQHPHLEYIMETLWKNQVLKNVNVSVEQVKQSTQYKQLIQQYPKFDRFFNVHIRMMAQAIDKIGEHKYEVVNGKIGYKIGASSDSISTDVYYGYSTNFAYFQEFDRGNVSEQEKKKQIGINLQCGYYSYADAPKKYLKILGVTGTLETLHEESLRVISQYIQVMSAAPSQFGDSRLSFDKAKDIKAAMDEDNMFLTLAEMIDKGLQDLRPVLVFFRDTETLCRFKQSNHCKFKDPIIIEPKSENIANLVVKSIRKGQLVLLDRVFGRGTDFICLDKSIDDKGGILVIQTFFSQDKSEEQQIRGRTARQQRKGQYQLIVNAKDLEEDFHIKPEETQQYKESISTIYDGLLDKKRFSVWGEQLKKLTQSIVEADKKHKQTEKYLDQLIKNKRDEAILMLIQFNFSALKPDKTSAYHFIFCLDDSGSMKSTDGTPKTRWQNVVDAIQSFVQQRENSTDGFSEDIVSIIYYSSDAVSVCKFEPISNVMTIISQNPPRWGWTYFSTAIKLTQQILESEPSTHKSKSKIVMFLSDGGDGDSNTVLVNSISSLIAMNNKNTGKIVSWWNMGFGPGAEAGVLEQMSQLLQAQGGKYVTALNAAELQAKFTEIAQPEAIVMK